MKKEYKVPTIEVIALLSEELLQESAFDPAGILDGNADYDWFN